jgi:endothelin-converting enzyme/putative endopeptidase
MHSRVSRLLSGAAVALFCATGSALADPALMSKPLDPAFFDKTANACEDFYKYANGGWIASHPIPAHLSRWGSFDQLSEANLRNMHDLLDKLVANPDKSNPDFVRVTNYYRSCMDEDRIEKEGDAWLQAQLKPIDDLAGKPAIFAEVAKLHAAGVPVLFAFGSTPDGLDSDKTNAGFGQGGLSLPNRDYYTRDDDKAKMIRQKLVEHIAKMFVLAGEDATKADGDAKAVFDLEMQLALASRTPVELRDPLKNYNPTKLADLQAMSPDFDLKGFMKAVDSPSVDMVDVGQPDFIKALGPILAKADPAALKAYLRWNVIASGGNALPKRFVDEQFEFTKLLSGAKEQRPRWQRCVRSVKAAMPDAVGKLFIKNFVAEGTKERMTALVHNVRQTLREDIQELDWMSPPTKKLATAKLDKMTEHIAFPDKPIDYTALKIGDHDLYGDVIRASSKFEEKRDMKKIGKPTNHDEWQMSAMETNAYYNPPDNSITFPAGILFAPFFDVKADDAVNYGGIGVVIGHEMTHGFDDQGRNYDAKGNLKDWWTKEDADKFAARGKCISDEFDGFVAVDDVHENGKLEEGEAIADLGGTVIAHRAFLKTPEAKAGKPIDGLTPDQRFYASFGQIWAQNIRPEEARTRALSDPHPLANFRVVGTIGNVPGFATAYQCGPNAPMVRKDVCKIW